MVAPTVTLAGQILWEQLPVGSSYIDQDFTDYPDFSTFMLNDVVFTDPVTIETITAWFTPSSGQWPTNGFAVLNIFDDPLLATDDPRAGLSVPIILTDDNSGHLVCEADVQASLGGIDLEPGTYWIGITPELDFSTYDQEYHREAATLMGQPTMIRNPGGVWGWGTGWNGVDIVSNGGIDDAAIKIFWNLH